MAITTDVTFRLGLYESKSIVEIQTVSPGTYIIPMSTDGNSILSTLFVNTCPFGASVKVNYYDFGPGDGTLAGERYDLESHDLISTPAFTDRILVTKMHNKPRAEIIVSGGSVEFGVYVTVVGQSASDIDSALVEDGETHVPATDKGIPIVCLNRTTGLYEFISCPMPVTFDSSTVQTTKQINLPLAGTEYSHAFPANTKKYKLWISQAAMLRYATISGNTGIFGEYVEVCGGGMLEADGGTQTIYLRTTLPNTIVNLQSWA